MYLLIKPSEDGNPIIELTSATLQELLDHPENYGVKRWVDRAQLGASKWGKVSAADWDTNYWPEGAAILLKAEVVVPVPAPGYRLPD